jgi:putative two-component system response regulator
MQYPLSEGRIKAHSFIDSLVNSMVRALEHKDRLTGEHVRRTAEYALRIAAELPELPGAAERGIASVLSRIRAAALLHDIGKLRIEEEILRKGSSLDETEWEKMREHPRLGFELLCGLEGAIEDHRELAEATLFHHERWDGEGYPTRRAGRQIPWLARLIAVADAYDAMVSTRVYRRGMGTAQAYGEILLGSGTQFDPEMVAAFARAFAPERVAQVQQAPAYP